MRKRLFSVLMVATGVVWCIAAGAIYFGAQHLIQRVLDSRLQESAQMVLSLAQSAALHRTDSDLAKATVGTNSQRGEREISCQIWSIRGELLGTSASAPQREMATQMHGFQDSSIDGVPWRVFAITDQQSGLRVLVGDSLEMRSNLVQQIIYTVLMPGLVILPILALIIWFSIRHGMVPLRRLTIALRERGTDDLHAIPEVDSVEMQPVVGALNNHFMKVAAARQRERDFTAFAAHELQTPLAALRLQAQIALAADTSDVRATALRQTIVGVDRTTRLVRQLLQMARLDADLTPGPSSSIDILQILEELETELAALIYRRRIGVCIDSSLHGLSVDGNEIRIALALRNIFENALQHSPVGGTVKWVAQIADRHVDICVADDGSGVAHPELNRLTERFFRVNAGMETGSGLGLSIASLAMKLEGGQLSLKSPKEGGFLASVQLPIARIRKHPDLSSNKKNS